MVRLLAARPDSTFILLHCRRGAPLLDRQPAGARPITRADVVARVLASPGAHSAGGGTPLDAHEPDLLDLRRHTQPDRPRLRRALFARLPARTRSMDRAGHPAGRVLGRIHLLPAART